MSGSAPAPAGIYVHLPYCRSRCGYCAFVVTTDESSRRSYLEALGREIEIVGQEADGVRFDSVYLGGGTPSRVSPEELSGLLGRLRRSLRIDSAAEVTLEANPDDVTPDLALAWAAMGVTRVSAGVQSFDDRELAAVGRRHDSDGARLALAALTSAGLSVSADLILGLPEQTAKTFGRSVEEVRGFGIGHVSVYLLETEKSKTIEEDRRHNPTRYLSDDAQADLWLALGERLADSGFSHYEISNWALPGGEARHNLKYWLRLPTLGLGVSAHEFWGGHRRANVSAIPGYLSALEAGRRPVALDHPVGDEEAARERIVLGLRLADGIPRPEVEAWIAGQSDATLAQDLEGWQANGLVTQTSDRLRLTERGFLVSNEILCRFV